jgi:hypothetical protein
MTKAVKKRVLNCGCISAMGVFAWCVTQKIASSKLIFIRSQRLSFVCHDILAKYLSCFTKKPSNILQ